LFWLYRFHAFKDSAHSSFRQHNIHIQSIQIVDIPIYSTFWTDINKKGNDLSHLSEQKLDKSRRYSQTNTPQSILSAT
jgi:hypothetical protein